jgi:hypothetical protein
MELQRLSGMLGTINIDEMRDDYDDITIGDVRESIETNLWLGEAYHAHGAQSLAVECWRAANAEWTRFEPLLIVAYGPVLGQQIRRLAVEWGIA